MVAKGSNRNRHSNMGGYVPWYVADGAEFDQIEVNGYNAHAKIRDVEDTYRKVTEFITTLEDVGVVPHSHIHIEEYEEDPETFYGVTMVRPTIRTQYLGFETDPWDDWDPEQMFMILEGKRPPKEVPAADPPPAIKVVRCSKCREIGHNALTCDAPWTRRPRKQDSKKNQTRAQKQPKTCSICGKPGHNARTCGVIKKQGHVCSLCGKAGHNARTCGTKGAKKKGVYICSMCGKAGHNKRTCPQRPRI